MKPLFPLIIAFGLFNSACQKTPSSNDDSTTDAKRTGYCQTSVGRVIEGSKHGVRCRWSIAYSDGGVVLIASDIAGIISIAATHKEVPKLQEAIEKFVKWDEAAKQNDVTGFEKDLLFLQPDQRFSFVNSRGVSSVRGSEGHLYADDLKTFTELLKAIPELKAELDAKKAKLELIK